MSGSSAATRPARESCLVGMDALPQISVHSDAVMKLSLERKDIIRGEVSVGRLKQVWFSESRNSISASKILARLDSPRNSGSHRNRAFVLHALPWLELHRSAATENQRFTMMQEVTRNSSWALRGRSKFLTSLSRMASWILDACVGLDNLSQKSWLSMKSKERQN
jgi:hypothetical protein